MAFFTTDSNELTANEFLDRTPFLEINFEGENETLNKKLKASNRTKYGFVNYYAETNEKVKFSIGLNTESNQMHSGEVMVPAGAAFMLYTEFTENEIQNPEYVLDVPILGLQKCTWLLGDYSFCRSQRVSGLAAGKLIIDIDNHTTEDQRTIEYTLVDDQLVMVFKATNTNNEPYRLRMNNSFLYADQGDFETTEILEVCLLPGDQYRIDVVIEPTGEILTSHRRL